MLSIILSLIVLAFLCPLICYKRFPGLGWLLALAPAALFIFFALQIPHIVEGQTISSSTPWLSAAGINFSFYLDGLSLLFCLLITGIGTLIVIYSFNYLYKHPSLGRFFTALFLFMASMLGAVLANNLFLLFIFWEMTSVASYLLISFDHEKKAARRAALQGLFVTAAGGLALLAGLAIITQVTGHHSISWLLNNPNAMKSSQFYDAVVLLLLAGAFTKSAQFPFHFWLPNAMQAPTPVSAYLHSATMVKLGVYLVARFTPILGHTLLWSGLLSGFGAVTMLVASVLALRASDLKQILAYSTLMALGTLMFMLASGNQACIEAAIAFLFAHALYKACLFLCAGAIDKATGTREIRQLGGLLKFMPLTFIAVLLASLSLAGWPPVIGFISKEMVYNAKLASGDWAWILVSIAFLTNVAFVCLAYLFVIKPFKGKKQHYPAREQIKEVPFSMLFCTLLLAILGLVFGLQPWLIDGNLISPAVSSILRAPVSTELVLWHGLSPAFLLSIATSLVALIVFFAYSPIQAFLAKQHWINRFSPENGYQVFLKGLNQFALLTCRIIQPGSLRLYTTVLFLALGAISCFTFFHFKHVAPAVIIPHAPWFAWLICLTLVVAVITALAIRSYLTCLVLLGLVGLSSTLIFLLYSAPDVAMTQLLIDVLTIVIIVLALYRLPSLPPFQGIRKKQVIFNTIVALFVGLTITFILLSIISVPLNLSISHFYDAKSLVAAHGRNIVNVILVDFRAFDTFGEILVVAIAGLGVYGLLNFPKKKSSKEAK